MPFNFCRLVRAFQNTFVGRVSKRVVLTIFLPLSILTFFGTLFVAANYFPVGYDWQKIVISKLSSPRHNPDGNLFATFGVMATMALVLPMAGYIASRLQPAWPKLSKWVGVTFGIGFILMFLSMALQSANIHPRLHETLARVSAGILGVGMFCCCICGLKDRRRWFGGKQLLPTSLTWCWAFLTVVPALVLGALGIIFLLGQHGGQAWAEDFRQSFRQTPMWHLAFWEWVGATVGFVFLTSSAALLPVHHAEAEREPLSREVTA